MADTDVAVQIGVLQEQMKTQIKSLSDLHGKVDKFTEKCENGKPCASVRILAEKQITDRWLIGLTLTGIIGMAVAAIKSKLHIMGG